jgi:hypothetical protein
VLVVDVGGTSVKVLATGIVYQKDLGPDTAKIAAGMKRYNPDKTWRRTDDEW